MENELIKEFFKWFKESEYTVISREEYGEYNQDTFCLEDVFKEFLENRIYRG